MSVTFSRAERVDAMQSSSTMAATQAAARLRAAGHDVVDLGAGEPDFTTPENIREAAKRALDSGKTKYTPAAGTAELKNAIIGYIERETGTKYEPSQVIVSAGGKQVLFNGITTLINPADEVIIPAPYWVTFPEIVTFCGGKSVFVDTESNGFQLTAKMVADAVTPKTKLIIVNSPSNPSGRIMAPEEFRAVAELVAERGLWMISDECYYRFTYPPYQPLSAASLPAELRERVLISGSFSKTYAMTGWRIGYALAHRDWVTEMSKVQSHSTSNPTSFAQWGAVEAAQGDQSSIDGMLAEYQKRRDWLIPALNEIPGVSCAMPEGAFYAFPSIKGVLAKASVKTDSEFSDLLLNEAHVVVTPGSAFGMPGYLRISYANSLEAIQRGVDRMRQVIEKVTR
ncbi:MAG: pyridoxal phosphate-dependent aminotransferase [Blastocatellia bacterium]|nr:pyridoxal phosphate-dependent aminotransferase [Blastocatellia bacterium]